MTREIKIEERVDHLNHLFPTIQKMCDYWGINEAAYMSRRYRGFSVEAALTTVVTQQSHRGVWVENPYTHETKPVYEWTRELNEKRVVWEEEDGYYVTKSQILEPDKATFKIRSKHMSFPEAFGIIKPIIGELYEYELFDGFTIVEPSPDCKYEYTVECDGEIGSMTRDEIIAMYLASPKSFEVYMGWLNYYRNI